MKSHLASIALLPLFIIAIVVTGCNCSGVPSSQLDGGVGDGGIEKVAVESPPEKEPQPEPQPEPRPEAPPEKSPHGNFTVDKTSNVLTQTYVKGAKNVATLSFAIRADRNGRIPRIAVRFYGDSKGLKEFSSTGDLRALEFVSSATLYIGNEIVAGPEALELVSPIGNFRPDSGDYSRALFDHLSLRLKKGQAVQLEVRVNLTANFNGSRYLAADIIPPEDIVVENEDGEPMATMSLQLNAKSGAHNPEIIIVNNGKLTFTYSDNIGPMCMLAGDKELATVCYVTAEGEPFDISRLSVVNDLKGKFGDEPRTSATVGKIEIVYSDENGVEHSDEGFLNSSHANYTLGGDKPRMFVPKDKTVTLKIYVTIRFIGLEQPLRLGLDEVGNYLKATGVYSSYTFTNPVVTNPEVVTTHQAKNTCP